MRVNPQPLWKKQVLNPRQSSLRLTTSETNPKRRVSVPHVCRRNDARKFDANCPESRLLVHVRPRIMAGAADAVLFRSLINNTCENFHYVIERKNKSA